MRKLFLAALLAAGCSSTPDAMNRGVLPGEGNYPLGPYGYAKGSVIANLSFLGKVDPDGAQGTAVYPDLTPQTMNLSDYYNQSGIGWLVLTGAAGWCNPCRMEASTIPTVSKKWEPMGVRFITVLIQGFDETDGTPATMADVDMWQEKTGEHIALATDPKDNLHDFSSEIGSFPLNMIVRTADMAIMYSALGVDSTDPSIDPILSAYVN